MKVLGNWAREGQYVEKNSDMPDHMQHMIFACKSCTNTDNYQCIFCAICCVPYGELEPRGIRGTFALLLYYCYNLQLKLRSCVEQKERPLLFLTVGKRLELNNYPASILTLEDYQKTNRTFFDSMKCLILNQNNSIK